MTGPVMPREHPRSSWLLTLCVLIIICGVVITAAPRFRGLDSRVVIAWMLLATSSLHLAFAWPFRSASSVMWQVLLSVANFAIGLYLLGHTDASLDSIRLPVVVYLLIDGLLEWALFFRVIESSGRRWLLLDAVATIAIAVMVAVGRPSREAWAMAALIGINVILGGLTRLFVSFSLRNET